MIPHQVDLTVNKPVMFRVAMQSPIDLVSATTQGQNSEVYFQKVRKALRL